MMATPLDRTTGSIEKPSADAALPRYVELVRVSGKAQNDKSGYALVLKGQRPSEALMLGRHALRWAGRAGIPVARSKAQHFLGLVHQAIGEPQVAARYHQAALEEARLAGDRRSTAELLIVMANAVQETERTPQSRGSARALLEEASSLSQQIEWGEGVRMVEQHIADLVQRD